MSNMLRELVLDTETTGFLYDGGDRVIEIGIVELINKKLTGRTFHVYIDPKRDVPEEAYEVHELSRDELVKLSGGKGFEKIAEDFIEFVRDSVIVAHNASFDTSFLNAELRNAGLPTLIDMGIPVVDTLALARAKYPGQAASLDALAKRLLGSNNFSRDLHGALLDASLLAQVYQVMCVHQVGLKLESKASLTGPKLTPERISVARGALVMPGLSLSDKERHLKLCERISKSSGGQCLSLDLCTRH